jgi:hypothetical protein
MDAERESTAAMAAWGVVLGGKKIGARAVHISGGLDSTCPADCPLRLAGACYARALPAWRMRKAAGLDAGLGVTWTQACSEASVHVERGRADAIRLAVYGDVPSVAAAGGPGRRVDVAAIVAELGNRARPVWGYTHHGYGPCDAEALLCAGIVIRRSCEGLMGVDVIATASPGVPIATMLPSASASGPRTLTTLHGRPVIVCPEAHVRGHAKDCLSCGLCWKQPCVAVGVPAHGGGRKRADAITA